MRLERHIALARNRNRRPKWHVDYLLMSDHFPLRYAVSAKTTQPLECSLAAAIGGEHVPDFGCSDCTCESHLFFRRQNPLPEVRKAFGALGLLPATTTILMNPERIRDR